MLDESEKLFIKSVKEYLEVAIPKAQTEEQFDVIVEGQLLRLLLLKNKELNKIIVDYYNEQDVISKELDKILKEYSQKKTIYHDNVKSIYEEIKKL